MRVFNFAAKDVAVRSFAADHHVGKEEYLVIKPGMEAVVNGPVLTGYGLKLQYQMLGIVVVRDWSRPNPNFQLGEDVQYDEVVVVPGKCTHYKRPCEIAPNEFEGFSVAFLTDLEKIQY